MTTAPKRPSMTKARRARLFLAHDGVCELCGLKISGPYEIEHRIAWAISFRDDDDNLYPAHPECHKPKTARDRKIIAKVNRIDKRVEGRMKPKKSIPVRVDAWPKGRKIPSRPFR